MTTFSFGEDSETVRKERRSRYLEQWPIHRQLEAYKEAAEGRKVLLEQMLKDLAEIKATLPYPEDNSNQPV